MAGTDLYSVLNVDLPTTIHSAVNNITVSNLTQLFANTLNLSEEMSPSTSNVLINHCSTTAQPNPNTTFTDHLDRYTCYVSRSEPHQVSYTKDRLSPDSRLSFICTTTVDGKILVGLVDTGASLSLIALKQARKLGLEKLRETPMRIQGFCATTSYQAYIFALQLRSGESNNPLAFMITSSITLPETTLTPVLLTKADKNYLRSHGIDPQLVLSQNRYTGRPIDLIIGNDFISWWNAHPEYCRIRFHLGESLRKLQLDGSFTQSTVKITASEYGTWTATRTNTVHHVSYANILLDGQEPEDCHQLIAYEIEQSWRTENIGIEDILTAENNKKSTQDLLEQFNKTVRYDKDGHLEVAFPYNGNESRLSDNYAVAYKRLENLLVTLQKGNNQLLEYSKIIDDQLTAGYIEK
ncbi:hypothetical protein B9Z55_015231 [Caenorhabditis nigoni]|uniref:Peptidase A2 domain-containing protein n=1 Tax=Caenorhabditis nigoni TaxID=1611254 RepID=A0A2G5U9A5_9PELO|nr:hypothetical protein B9Z55_015231 [Caenorhabditis nigoni]